MKVMRTYNSVWKIEKVLYGIQDIPLPLPVTYRQLGFFTLGFAMMWVLNLFPPFSILDLVLLEFVVIPALFAWYFTKQQLDGKAPHRFILRVIQFYFEPHVHNRYKEMISTKKPLKFDGKVAYRKIEYINRELMEEKNVGKEESDDDRISH
jgi:hypothetical protein